MSSRHLLAVTLAVMLFAVGSVAHASFVTYDSTPVTYGPEDLNWSGAEFTFPQWNPADYPPMTDLVAIEIWLEGNLLGSHGYNLLRGTVDKISMQTTATITLFSPGGGTVVVTTPAQLDEWFNKIAPSQDQVFMDNTDTEIGWVDPGDFGLFTGAGTVTTPLTGVSIFDDGIDGGGGSTIAFINAPEGSARGRITYHYEIIPEPGTVALMALGLVGLAGVITRRRKRDEV